MTDSDAGVGARVACWCCGEQQDEATVVRLGDHPEVVLCLRCAHVVHRRARAVEDAGVRTMTTRARAVVRTAESFVVRHDLQHQAMIGPLLRWLGPRLP